MDNERSSESSKGTPSRPIGERVRADSASDIDRLIDKEVENYKIIRFLGQGGMGVVYEARENNTWNRVALKVLHKTFAKGGARLLEEARRANMIEHEGIVRALYFGQITGEETPYIVMEYCHGITLRERLDTEQGVLHRRTALWFARQIAASLAAAHEAGIVHRDLKPSNIMLVSEKLLAEGRTKILDFGLAQYLAADAALAAEAYTRSLGFEGTPKYMAPEQWLRTQVTGQTDVYALGFMLYEMLSGSPPYYGKNVDEWRYLHEHEAPRPLREIARSIPADLAELVIQMLAKQPQTRPTMCQVEATLVEMLAHSEVPTNPRLTLLQSECPFPGLRPFVREMSRHFSGRDHDIEQSVQLLGNTPNGWRRWLHLEGPPGVGKSSLARAGILPALERGRGTMGQVRVVELSPAADLVVALACAISPVLKRSAEDLTTELRQDQDALRRILSNWHQSSSPRTLVLLIDPFDSVLRNGGSSVRHMDTLLASALADSHGPLYLLTAMRGRDLWALSELPGLSEEFRKASRHFVGPLTAHGYQQVLEVAVPRAGLRLEPELVQRMLNELRAAPDGLLMLGVTLQELWKRRRNMTLTLDAYQDLGGLSRALAHAADALFAHLTDDERQRSRRLLSGLARSDGQGSWSLRTLSWFQAKTLAGGDSQAELLLSLLSGEAEHSHERAGVEPPQLLHLFNTEEADSQRRRIELAHHVIIDAWPMLRTWVQEDKDLWTRWDDVEQVTQKLEQDKSPSTMHLSRLEYLRGGGLVRDKQSLLESLFSERAKKFLADSRREEGRRVASTQRREQSQTDLLQQEQAKRSAAEAELGAIREQEKSRAILLHQEQSRRMTAEAELGSLRQRLQQYDSALQQAKAEVQQLRAVDADHVRELERLQFQVADYSNQIQRRRNSGAIGATLGAVFAAAVCATGILVSRVWPHDKSGGQPSTLKDRSLTPDFEQQRTSEPGDLSADSRLVEVPERPSRPTQRSWEVGKAYPFKGGVMMLVPAGKRPLGASVKPLLMDQTEVTVAAYAECVEEKACEVHLESILDIAKNKCEWNREPRENHPMNCVSAGEARRFCEWAGKRLPTVEEWVYAAVGSDGRRYPWGNESPETVELCWKGRQDRTCEVGSHRADRSPFGMLDMVGNVQEWLDGFHSDGVNTAFRGGNWASDDPTKILPETEHGWKPDARQVVHGFRCAANLPAAASQ